MTAAKVRELRDLIGLLVQAAVARRDEFVSILDVHGVPWVLAVKCGEGVPAGRCWVSLYEQAEEAKPEIEPWFSATFPAIRQGLIESCLLVATLTITTGNPCLVCGGEAVSDVN